MRIDPGRLALAALAPPTEIQELAGRIQRQNNSQHPWLDYIARARLAWADALLEAVDCEKIDGL